MKKLLLMLFALITTGAWAQTDVTSTYLTNADFSQSTPIESNLKGYGKDGTPYGFQTVDGWTSVVLSADNSNASYPNSGMGGAVFAYGSSYQLQGNNKAAPATNPNGEASGNCLGFFGVWGCGGYYYQEITLPAGNYSIIFTYYNQSGTTNVTNLFGFETESNKYYGSTKSFSTGSWKEETVSFTLTEETTGKVSIGYTAPNKGSSDNPMLFVDCVKILGVSALDVAKGEALAALPGTDGDGFFTMDQTTIDEFTTRINTATTVEGVEAIKAEIEAWKAPALSGEWNIQNNTAVFYLGVDGDNVVLSEQPVAVTFEKKDNGFAIKVGEKYINMKGGNTWSMAATSTASTAWTFTLSDGKYTIAGPNGLIGTDNVVAGSTCYGNKAAANNGYWKISKAVNEDEAELIVAKNALQAALNATVAAPTTNIGTAAFQYKQEDVEAYAAAIADAQDVLDNAASTKAELEAQTEIVKNLEPLVLNAPADGQLFNVVLTYEGWTYDKKAITYLANARDGQGNYNIQYKEAANTNLAQAFTFTKVEGNNYKMSQIDADGNVRYMTTGVPYGGNASQIRTSTKADDAMVVTVIPTATEGKWNLRNTEANQYIGSQDAGVYTVNSHIDFVLAETTKPSIKINTTEAGWGTTMLPFAVASLPTGVKAYTCAAIENNTLTLEEVETLEANKPYIIEGAWNETLTGDAQGTALTYTEGLLTGTYVDYKTVGGEYVLQNHDGKVGFFKVDTSVAEPKVPANRAYIASEGGNVKAFYLGGDTDGINSLVNDLQNGDIYDLAGRKVQRMQKGNVYIVNGKKVVVK